MILKNIFGKTIEAAKKSASAIYGEDFLVLDSAEAAKKAIKPELPSFLTRKRIRENNSNNPENELQTV